MNMHEYDKFEIPEEYKRMSRIELRQEAECILKRWREEHPRKDRLSEKKKIILSLRNR